MSGLPQCSTLQASDTKWRVVAGSPGRQRRQRPLPMIASVSAPFGLQLGINSKRGRTTHGAVFSTTTRRTSNSLQALLIHAKPSFGMSSFRAVCFFCSIVLIGLEAILTTTLCHQEECRDSIAITDPANDHG